MTNHHTSSDWPVFQMPTPQELERIAALLPPPVPGRIISIPWFVYPIYMSMHKLTPAGASPLGNVYVKRGEQ